MQVWRDGRGEARKLCQDFFFRFFRGISTEINFDKFKNNFCTSPTSISTFSRSWESIFDPKLCKIREKNFISNLCKNLSVSKPKNFCFSTNSRQTNDNFLNFQFDRITQIGQMVRLKILKIICCTFHWY